MHSSAIIIGRMSARKEAKPAVEKRGAAGWVRNLGGVTCGRVPSPLEQFELRHGSQKAEEGGLLLKLHPRAGPSAVSQSPA